MTREEIIKEWESVLSRDPLDAPWDLIDDTLTLLKELNELLCKLQKDKDKLCFEVSEWKHKFHDAPPKFVPQGVVDQIRWERDIALSQLEQIGKGLGSKMDDIVAMLKEQEAVEPYMDFDGHDVWRCGKCGATIFHIYHNASDEDAKNYAKFCRHCGRSVKWE